MRMATVIGMSYKEEQLHLHGLEMHACIEVRA